MAQSLGVPGRSLGPTSIAGDAGLLPRTSIYNTSDGGRSLLRPDAFLIGAAPLPDVVQRAIATALVIAVAPLLAILALLIRLDSRGPILYRATRIGEGGRPFVCLKLRTMRAGRAAPGPAITVTDDPRVTRVGSRLRAMRLDELPQLWNVVRGEMRLVGPRPEDPRFVDMSDALHREVFGARPGITGLSQLVFIDEARLLPKAGGDDAYRSTVLPRKLVIDRAYLRARSTALDVRILAWTLGAIVGRQPPRRVISSLLGSDDWELPAGRS